MNASKLIISSAAILATVGAIGLAQAQSTTAPVPSTTKATDPNREAQQRTNKPGTANPSDASPVNSSTSNMNGGAATRMDKSNTGPMTKDVPNTTDNSSTGTTMNNNTMQATPDNTSTMNNGTTPSRRVDRATSTSASGDAMGTTGERAPKADRN
jgi:hypothetical protein